jgi:uncharacterized protein (DUF2236 family)
LNGAVQRVGTARPEVDGFLPRSSPLRRLAKPTATAFAGGRAILMELAHPSVARGVAEFDHFREAPVARAQLTAKAFRDVIHGSEQEARAVGQRLARVHRRVRGAGYAASDPQLLLWVHATFIDSLLRFGQRLYGSLTAAEEHQFYEEAVTIGEVFGCPRDLQPPTIDAFRRYVDDMVMSLTVTDTGRELARAVFWPDVPVTRQPLVAVYRLACFESLPPALRTQFPRPSTTADLRMLRAGRALAPRVAQWTDRAFFAVADGNGRGVAATLALAGVRQEPRHRV